MDVFTGAAEDESECLMDGVAKVCQQTATMGKSYCGQLRGEIETKLVSADRADPTWRGDHQRGAVTRILGRQLATVGSDTGSLD